MNRVGVVDLGFGDSGKGITTAYLANKGKVWGGVLVVRSNGGHQAGHNVVKRGISHIHSQTGSGTLFGADTFISKFCTFEPTAFLQEYHSLLNQGIGGFKIYVDPLAMLTTPMDIICNQRSKECKDLGTVGVGFGQTLERNEKFFNLHFQDIYCLPILKNKLKNIKELYYKYVKFSEEEEELIEQFIEHCQWVAGIDSVVMSNYWDLERVNGYHQYIVFEGAQGVLLDQHHGVFPNVTRSNTTSKNMIEIGNNLQEIYYVTRTYQTRHGSGFMTNEDKPIGKLPNSQWEINKTHPYQGKFRKTELDVELLKHSLRSDLIYSKSTGMPKRNLVITCYDQLKIDIDSLVDELETVCKFKDVILSTGPDPEGFVHWRKNFRKTL